METAFTVSIEAREGVTTGISAADRARTIAVAIDAANGPDAIVSPGHVFPLVARPGGVLVRAGHTEAAVDVARLAGLNPSGVICEIMREDGTMARLDDLIEFAAAHGLKIGTIRDLIAYRLQQRPYGRARSPRPASPRAAAASWAAKVFRDKASGDEQLALVHGGDRRRTSRPWCGCTASTCSPTSSASSRSAPACCDGAMAMIEAEGAGVIVALHAASPGSLSRSADLRSGKPAGGGEALRDYGIGAQILAALGIHDMILLTNTRHAPVGLVGLRPGDRRGALHHAGGPLMARILIVEARFYAHLNDMLLAGARAAIEAAGHEHETITVPGALELPGAIALAAEERPLLRLCRAWASSSAARPIISRSSPTKARAA